MYPDTSRVGEEQLEAARQMLVLRNAGGTSVWEELAYAWPAPSLGLASGSWSIPSRAKPEGQHELARVRFKTESNTQNMDAKAPVV